MNETLQYLRNKGYNENFLIKKEELSTGNRILTPKEVKIDYTFRVEADSDPTHQAIVYGISSNDSKTKGLLVDAYGTYSDPKKSEFIEKISF